MASTDFVSLFFQYLPHLVDAGTDLYEWQNNNNVSSNLKAGAQSDKVDPWGTDNRNAAKDRIRALYEDPTSIQDSPGYKFALQQGTDLVNAEAAQMGKYMSTGRLYGLQEFGQGLASQTFDATMEREMQMAGANYRPDAASYGDMLGTAAGIDLKKDNLINSAVGDPGAGKA